MKVLGRWLRAWKTKQRRQELDEELAFHLAKEEEANLKAGMPTEEARRQALIAFGGVQKTRELVAEVRWARFWGVLLQDARYAGRLSRKSPGFTTAVVITLALGIGMNTAVFSLINAVLFRPLPASHQDQLVLLRWHARHRPRLQGDDTYGYCDESRAQNNAGGCSLSLPWLNTVRSQGNLFSGVAAFAGAPALDLSGNGPATIINNAQLVSGDFFPTLGIKAALGRTLLPDDDSATATPALMLSYGFWKRAFGGAPGALGRTIRLDGLPFTIVGVAEPGFEGLALGNHADLWVPLSARPRLIFNFTPHQDNPGSWWLTIVGRLKQGVSSKHAQAALNLLFRNETEFGQMPLFKATDEPGLDLVPAQEGLTGGRERTLQPLYVLMMAVGLVLLITCANIGGLLLARGARRSREIAVRLTLGARRGRVISQLLTESTILSALGGILGLLVGRWGARLLLLVSFRRLAPHLDGRVLAFTFAVSALTALLFGLAPALRTLRVDVMPALKSSGGSDATGRGPWYSMGNLLVVAQVALAAIALVSAGLMVRTLRNLKAVDLGFDPHNVLVFGIDSTLTGYKGTQVDSLNRELQRKFAALPGVTSVSYSWFPLLAGSLSRTDFHPPGTPDRETAQVGLFPVGPHFFGAMRIPLLAGRDLSSADFAVAEAKKARAPNADPDLKASPLPALVNQMFVNTYFPHSNPLGQHVENVLYENPKWPRGPGWVIVGVVGDAKYNNLRSEIIPTMYVPSAGEGVSFAVRSTIDPRQLVRSIRDIVNRRDSNLALNRVATESEQIDQWVFFERMVAQLSTFFAVLALLLACGGIYGLLSYEVTRRTREIGIRMAIGAQQNDVISMVLKHGLVLAAAGAVIGVIASLGATQLLRSLLYGVRATDPMTLAVVATLLLLVALAACYLPVRRATRVDPLVALRYE